MNSIPRWTVEELDFMYEREPDRRDIFVEGPFDAAVVRYFLQACAISSAVVYEINTVDVPDAELIERGQRPGERASAIWLTQRYFERVPSDGKNITCVVDADFSHLRGDFVNNAALLYTDYACMEMYFFSPQVLAKFFTIYWNKPDYPVAQIITALATVLQELFLCRFANDELAWNLDWLDKVTCMEANDWNISLDLDEFILRLLNKNARADQQSQSEFLGKVRELRAKLREDLRFQINGHDFVSVLIWLGRQKGLGGERADPSCVSRAVVLAGNFEQLRGEDLFARLIRRVGDNLDNQTWPPMR